MISGKKEDMIQMESSDSITNVFQVNAREQQKSDGKTIQ